MLGYTKQQPLTIEIYFQLTKRKWNLERQFLGHTSCISSAQGDLWPVATTLDSTGMDRLH